MLPFRLLTILVIAVTLVGGEAQRGPEKPGWAKTVGSDAQGWWADLPIGTQVQRMRWIPPGEFTMGSDRGERAAVLPADQEVFARGYEEIQHPVVLTRGFWMADSECTQGAWQEVMGAKGRNKGHPHIDAPLCGNRPAQ